MVVPTKVKPRFFRSRLMRSESGVEAGTSASVSGLLTMGLPST